MADMVSLERKPISDSAPEAPKQPYFPHSMHLDGDDLKKLGLSGVEIGDEKLLVARVRVTSISSDKREGGDDYDSVTLSITEASVEKEGKSQAERAETLFGS